MRVRFHQKGGAELRETFHGPRGECKIFDNRACTQHGRRGIRCGPDILRPEKIFLEACLKLSLRGANVMGIGLSPNIERLSVSEVEHAVASLSDGERTALTKIARLYARKTPYDKEDLIQETFARVLAYESKRTKIRRRVEIFFDAEP